MQQQQRDLVVVVNKMPAINTKLNFDNQQSIVFLFCCMIQKTVKIILHLGQ